ncbi:MAG: peptidylprolyl isomerase [Bacteroidales bacterium]|nr:peptidylprolyl isomerase [Bacteroidales bacterium]
MKRYFARLNKLSLPLPLLLFLLPLLLPTSTTAQDEVLLTIDNQPVMRSEFERIYRKNNNIQGFENKTPQEYLELFVNFKLKVHEAKMLGLDTLTSFRNELAGYKEQLAQPYLQDRKLIDSLLQEAYYRTLNEVNASHIMVKLAANPAPADTLKAYTRAMDIRKRLLAGESFSKIAGEESDDPSAKTNNGRLGWFSAFVMVLPFENAAYNLEIGEYSMPVRSRYGYHIIRLNDKRLSMGEIRLSHIMIRAAKNDKKETQDQAKEKIFQCYQLLQNGSPFSEVAKQHSEDAGSAQSGGQMRWLRSGELPQELEEVVFKTDSGAFTEPLQSDFGWHIFRIDGKRTIAPFSQMKSQLEQRIMADERGKISSESFLSSVKKENGFVSYPGNMAELASMMDSSVYSGNWNMAVAGDLIDPVFVIGTKEYTQKDLAEYILQTKQYRLTETLSGIVDKKSSELINRELIAFEKEQLEKKYPDFRHLMEEYHDGILLFNIMDDRVWNKAISDTAGLKSYFDMHRNDYMWKERANVSVYTFKEESRLKQTRKLAKKRDKMNWTPAEMVALICKNDTLTCVEIADNTYEKGESPADLDFSWEKGFEKMIRDTGAIKLIYVNRLLPPEPKTLGEVRGQVTADYQNYLDKQWIETLRAKYTVDVNYGVLNQIQ